MKKKPLATIMLMAVVGSAATAQNVTPALTESHAVVLAKPVPVTEGDIVDRPYQVIGPVETFVQKPLWQRPPSKDKVHRELWERARRMGADAVVHATYSQPARDFMRSWGGRAATGQAIKFVTEAPPPAAAN